MRTKHLLVMLALAALPGDARAQLGGLIKKAAKSAAEGRVATSVAASTNIKPSDTFGPELTSASLDAVIRGLAATDAKLGEAKALRDEKDRLNIAYASATNAHDGDRQRFDERSRTIAHCQDSVIHARSQAAQDAYMNRMRNDPKAQAEMMRAAMAISQQSATGKADSAQQRRMMEKLAKAQGIDPAADSAVAVSVCGARPAKPGWLAEQDSARARIYRLENQVRDVENGADSAGAAASGMSRKDYALARERVVNWYAEVHNGHVVQVFGGEERRLLDARRAEIEQYRRALR
jgi:hypothetical protein